MLRKILAGIILLFLFIPLLQQEFSLVKTKDLSGVYSKTLPEPFTINNWLDGAYQTRQEKYLNENFGFRSTCVRINNQLAFSLYNEARAISVIIGKGNYLYGDGYVNSWYGTDFIGDSLIEENICKLKVIQDTLQKKNITLLLMFVPGKGMFFPEFLPALPVQTKKITNYECYRDRLKGSGIPLLDMCSYLCTLKAKSPYPLFPKTGIHWSLYGAEVSADSMGRFISALRHKDLPRISITDVEWDIKPRGSDDDVETGMNLLFPISKFRMAYPLIKVDTLNTVKPKALIIADSYLWNIYGTGRAGQLFTSPHFWYYYKDLYVPGVNGTLKNEFIDLKTEIEQQDVIILFANDARLLDLGEGFIDDAYDLYVHAGTGMKARKEARLKDIQARIEDMKRNTEYLNNIRRQAESRKIPIDSLLKEEATDSYDRDHQKR
ncbi:MAG: hypothetical protein ACHQRM_00720 [Bacteroidia bacterium]